LGSPPSPPDRLTRGRARLSQGGAFFASTSPAPPLAAGGYYCIEGAKRIKGCDAKICEQRKFVAWWAVNVRGRVIPNYRSAAIIVCRRKRLRKQKPTQEQLDAVWAKNFLVLDFERVAN
jgi:hypothetical protein